MILIQIWFGLMINWQRLLEQNSIEYITSGANTKRGNINIRCVYCGTSDPSKHLGINPQTNEWGCLRNSEHRGKSPVKLLMKLLNVSYKKAQEIAGLTKEYIDPDGFSEFAKKLKENKTETVSKKILDFPKEFVSIKPTGKTKRFYDYLQVRGFDKRAIELLTKDYLLSASIFGDFKDRIILPYLVNYKLVTWTARAISESSLRYKALSSETAIVKTTDSLYNHDALLTNSDYLFLVEGQFDALKLDLFGKQFGIRAVALGTNTINESQIYCLESGIGHFKKVVIMMDNTSKLSVIDSIKMKNKLQHISNVEFMSVPFGCKDTGELTQKQVEEFCRSL